MYTRIFYFILSLFLLSQANVSAQTIISTQEARVLIDTLIQRDSSKPEFIIHQDNRIDALLELKRIESLKKRGFDGFRIQIYSESSIDSSLAEAEAYKSAFENRYPELKVYLNYFDPDFKIRVGNFRNKIECEGILHKIKHYYPNCYTVRTLISFKELLLSTRADFLRDSLHLQDSIYELDPLNMDLNLLPINQTLNNNTNE
jgi:hypothetical protein